MNIIDNIKKRAKKDKKTIVLPESMDSRVIDAANKIVKEDIANIILLGNEEELSKFVDTSKIKVIDPEKSNYFDDFVNKLFELRQDKGMTLADAKRLLKTDYMYFACMLVKEGVADGIVSGACHSTSDTLRPALQIIKTKPSVQLVSAFFLMEVPNCKYGSNGTFIFADSGLVQNPTQSELANIAGSSAESFELLVEQEPYVAMLSHSTKGSAVKHFDVDKVSGATRLAKSLFSKYKIDGELQLDAAIDIEIAKMKVPDSKVAGKANVLIFPDLDAGNIGYKLVQRLAKAGAYGPITQGMAAPVNDLSRGCSVDDIVGVVAITAIQAQKK